MRSTMTFAGYLLVFAFIGVVFCTVAVTSGKSHATDTFTHLERWAATPEITQADVDEMRAMQIAAANEERKAQGLPPLSEKYMAEWRLHDLTGR